jgi:hypothetical protein
MQRIEPVKSEEERQVLRIPDAPIPGERLRATRA